VKSIGEGRLTVATWLVLAADFVRMTPNRSTNRGSRSFHRSREWIVPARIEDDEPQTFGFFDRSQHAIKRNGFVLDINVALELGVNQDQIIDAIFTSMPCPA
jgi:hypothetical protein